MEKLSTTVDMVLAVSSDSSDPLRIVSFSSEEKYRLKIKYQSNQLNCISNIDFT